MIQTILWNNNYKAQDQRYKVFQVSPCIMSILLFPQKFGQKSVHYTWPNTVVLNKNVNGKSQVNETICSKTKGGKRRRELSIITGRWFTEGPGGGGTGSWH